MKGLTSSAGKGGHDDVVMKLWWYRYQREKKPLKEKKWGLDLLLPELLALTHRWESWNGMWLKVRWKQYCCSPNLSRL